jgi:hypothetical protein
MTPEDIRAFNATMTAKIRGSQPRPYQDGGYVLRVVHTRGRTTGASRVLPLAVVHLHGHHYLCAPNRQRDWVRNLLANSWCRIERDPTEEHHAMLVDELDAARVIAAYLRQLDQPATLWPFPGDASVEQIRQHADQVAVFRLEPRTP